MAGPNCRICPWIVLVLSVTWVTGTQGQDYVILRLPPVHAELAPRPPYFSPVVQATAVQAINEPQPIAENRFATLDSSAMPNEIPTPVPGSLPAPQAFGGYEWQFMLEEYVIQTGDELEIKFRFTPELNETVIVRPDGLISLQIVGAVMAANRTPRELHEELVQAYTPALKNPTIVVHVRRFAGNHVFVGGEVGTPSRVPITGQISVLQAIIRAGGFKDTADERHVILRRDGGESVKLNLKADIRGRVVGNDVVLRPYDVIYVPKSRIAKVNLWVDQYIEKLLPFQRGTGIYITRELGGQ